MGGAIKLTSDAESWLKSNLNINVHDLNTQSQPLKRLMSANPGQRNGMSAKHEDQRRKSWALREEGGLLTEQNKQLFDILSEQKHKPVLPRRPMSAYSRGTQGSRMSNIPEVSKLRLQLISTDLFKSRQLITEHQKSEGGNLREVLSSSEIQSLLKRVGMPLEIGVVKALLKELGFNWNGKSCSMMVLFNKCQEYVYGHEQRELQATTLQTETPSKKKEQPSQKQLQVEDLLHKVKDLLYSSKRSMYDLFQEAKTGAAVDIVGFAKLVSKYCFDSLSEEQVEQVFKHAAKGMESLSYQDFEKVLSWPKASGVEWETRCFRAIREWMFKSNLSSETAFDLLLLKANKVLQKRLTRLDFHTAMAEVDLKFSAPEIDGLFRVLDINQDGELDFDEWTGRVYPDSQNPLQMLRETIQ